MTPRPTCSSGESPEAGSRPGHGTLGLRWLPDGSAAMGARGTGPQGRGDRAVVLACHHSGRVVEPGRLPK